MAVALSSLPQTACTPSLQCKERSHSLLLLCNAAAVTSRQGARSQNKIRVRPRHCQSGFAAGWEQQGIRAVFTGSSHSQLPSTLQERIWISCLASQHTTNIITGHKHIWQQFKEPVRSPNSYLRSLIHWHLAQIPSSCNPWQFWEYSSTANAQSHQKTQNNFRLLSRRHKSSCTKMQPWQ